MTTRFGNICGQNGVMEEPNSTSIKDTSRSLMIPRIVIEDTSVNEGKLWARTAETLSPPGDEKRSRNSDIPDVGESVPSYIENSQFDDTDGSVIITSAQKSRDRDSSDDSSDSNDYSADNDTPLTSTQYTTKSNTMTGESRSQSAMCDDGLSSVTTSPIHRSSSYSELQIENARLCRRLIPYCAKSAGNLKTADNSQSVTIDLLSQFREHIKNNMEKILQSGIQSVKDDLNNKITSMGKQIEDQEKRLDIVPSLIDAKINKAKAPIEHMAGQMSKNMAELDGKTADISNKMANLEGQVKALSDKLAACGNLQDPAAMARLESVERVRDVTT